MVSNHWAIMVRRKNSQDNIYLSLTQSEEHTTKRAFLANSPFEIHSQTHIKINGTGVWFAEKSTSESDVHVSLSRMQYNNFLFDVPLIIKPYGSWRYENIPRENISFNVFIISYLNGM